MVKLITINFSLYICGNVIRMYLIVSVVSFLVAGLTFFSGFGLGTLLMPVFAVFFSVQIAVAATAIVHLANNIFKVVLIGRKADKRIVLLFGLPAALSAIVGAWLLGYLSGLQPLYSYSLNGRVFEVLSVKFTIGALMVIFAVFELSPFLDRFSFSTRWISVGGILSGFFGGLSGHQGALRTIFLTRAGLSKEAFVGTIAVVATMVDIVRIFVYGLTVFHKHFTHIDPSVVMLVFIAVFSAWAGSFIGSRLLKKITMRGLRSIIGILLLALGIALGSGLV